MTLPEGLKHEVIDDARRLACGGASLEMILMFLRERGFDKIDSINTIRTLHRKSMAEAKQIVDQSETWSDRFHHDMQFRESALEALREIAASQDPNLPRIVIDERNHEKGGPKQSES